MSDLKEFSIGTIPVGRSASDRGLFAICGPCVIESEDHALRTALAVKEASEAAGVPVVFKASYDKANRTSVDSYRGPGLEAGLEILARIRREADLAILTDVHEVAQVSAAAEVCDVIQIPAFLCRQTDLLLAAGRSGCAVNVKKGQFLAPGDMRYPAEKIASTGNERILLTERGASFGYHNLVVDFRGLKIMQALDYPVILDVTHSLQLPSAAGGSSGGQPEFIETLARAGVAAGIDGVFFEVHEEPSRALSDGANALHLDALQPLLRRLKALAETVKDLDSLSPPAAPAGRI